jgi:hypothetical protein
MVHFMILCFCKLCSIVQHDGQVLAVKTSYKWDHAQKDIKVNNKFYFRGMKNGIINIKFFIHCQFFFFCSTGV